MLNMTNKYEGATRVVGFNENKLTLTRSWRHPYTGAWYAPIERNEQEAGIKLIA